MKSIERQLDQQLEKNQQLQQKVQEYTKINKQLEDNYLQAIKKQEFQQKLLVSMRQKLTDAENQVQQAKTQLNKTETKLALLVQQSGLEKVYTYQIKLENQIQELNFQLLKEQESNNNLQRELRITANALIIKESEIIPNYENKPKEVLKNSLLRTISALKSEADALDSISKENERKLKNKENELDQLIEQNDQIMAENLDVMQRNDELINQLIDAQNQVELLTTKNQELVTKSKQIASGYKNQSKQIEQLSQENQVLTEQTQKIFISDELEKQNKVLKKNFQILQQNFEEMLSQKEILERENNELKETIDAIQEQFNEEKLGKINDEIIQLKEQNQSLITQKTSLQKALITAAKIKKD